MTTPRPGSRAEQRRRTGSLPDVIPLTYEQPDSLLRCRAAGQRPAKTPSRSEEPSDI
jgi:hypothetical protein